MTKNAKPAQAFCCGSCGAIGLRFAAGVLTLQQAADRVRGLGWTLQLGASYCPSCAASCSACTGGVGDLCDGCASKRLVAELQASLRECVDCDAEEHAGPCADHSDTDLDDAEEDLGDDYDDSMDGDHGSALESVWGPE